MHPDHPLGAVDTPLPIARHLADAVLDGWRQPRVVCDTAAGDGRLLAAILEAGSGTPSLFGADVDAARWAHGRLSDHPGAVFARTDALGRDASDLWPGSAAAAGIDLLVGNPPFLGQLSSSTARSPLERERLLRLGGVIKGLADTAAAFLVSACEMVADGGRVAMIMPLSFLSTRDARPARRRVLELCALRGMWVSDGNVFPGADVETCALILERCDDELTEVRRWLGPEWTSMSPRRVAAADLRESSTWSHVVSDLLGDTPAVDVADDHGRLGEIATATAGFRDQFYGLAPLARELDGKVAGRTDGRAPLVTSGTIDPGRLRWSDTPATLAGRRLRRPGVDPSDLEPDSALERWVAARRVPKVLVATQTKVVEAVADPTGEWIPSTPVVSVESDEVFRVLAVLSAPPVTVWARQRFVGAARTASAIKLSARQVLDVPLPVDVGVWDEAADLLRASHEVVSGGVPPEVLVDVGRRMCAAYGVDDVVYEWWRARLPSRP